MSEKSNNDRINREFRRGENLGTADRRYAEFRIQFGIQYTVYTDAGVYR